MTRSLLVILPLLALLAAPNPGLAEDEPTPAARYAAKVATFAEPAAGDAFSFEGKLVMAGREFGTWKLAAEAAELGGKKVWKVSDSLTFAMGETKAEKTSVRCLAADLSVLEGTETSSGPGKQKSHSFKRGEGGIDLVSKENETEEASRIAVEGGAYPTSSMAALLLFCRLTLQEPGTYEMKVFNPDPDGEEPMIQAGTVRVEGLGEWKGKPAFLVTATLGGKTLSMGFAAETKAFLGMHTSNEGGMEADLVLAGETIEAPPAIEYTAPAKTPQQAVLVTFFAITTKNSELLDKVVDWKAIHALYTAKNPMPPMTVEGLREALLAQFAASPGQPREQVEMGLGMAAQSLKVEMAGEDAATVTFARQFGGWVIKTVKSGDAWLVTNLPGM